MRILIVDDSMAMRRILQRTLRQAGHGHHEVVEAENGKAALASVRSQAPDLILCDWNMPEMSGIELLQTLRAQGYAIPFGFVTSESTEEMRQLALGAGARFFLCKPFTPEDLAQALCGIS
jgi:two-component system chemotaxis response regulator CheY